MPPYVSRKRNASPARDTPSKRAKTRGKSKSTVFDVIDANGSGTATPEQTRDYLKQLEDSDDSASEEDDEDEFEDVPGLNATDGLDDGGEDDEMDWEDAIDADKGIEPSKAVEDVDIGDVTVTLSVDGKYATATDRAASTLRKGPSKRERQVRNGTHCIHVQALMWHNAMRNSWLNDKELQDNLVKSLPDGIKLEIERWRSDMGMPEDDTRLQVQKRGKSKAKRQVNAQKRTGRDWDIDADRLEKGTVNLSRGDPTLRLLKVLTAYWRKRFAIVAPSIRKLGYMPIKRLTQEINGWKKDRSDVQKYGERIDSVKELRKLAQSCEGSRDTGSQLFTALLRGLRLEARMVANLQPAGIGWGKNEEARQPKTASAAKKEVESESDSESSDKASKKPKSKKPKAPPRPTKTSLTPKQAGTVAFSRSSRLSTRDSSSKVISLDTDSESSLSSVPSDLEDDASVVDITESFTKRRPNKKYDRDMHYPNYWTEVLSPISKTWVAVDPIVLSTVATNDELLATFEPRGKRADQAKQVICYTVAHSADGSAKDVTVRYLRKHQLPGRTKGYRMPVEKIKVYNRKGKVRKYEEYDWFRTVMSLFERPHHLRTAADDLEESTVLKPFKPESTKPQAELESLQWYKQSAEFVLLRHLRREEAIPPWAKAVKMFKAGKGDAAAEEPVHRRSDVLLCKTAESWHKEGREIKIGEQPMKLVPMRAVTTTRKREMEEVERETGEKAKQGLFARDQTDWIIPPPIGEDRVIPRNAFGNIDVYVPSMVPRGAVHLPLKGAARICRDLNISHAEAVTGFEFGKRMAIPVITGVVIPEEHEKEVRQLWREKEKEKKRKEDEKRTQLCLGLWRKFFSGLRIVERMKKEYADTGREEDVNPFVRKAKLIGQAGKKIAATSSLVDDVAEMGGGFMPEGEEEGTDGQNAGVEDPDDDHSEDESHLDNIDVEGGGFVIEDPSDAAVSAAPSSLVATPITPMSMQSALVKSEQIYESEEEEPVPNNVSTRDLHGSDVEQKPPVDKKSLAQSRRSKKQPNVSATAERPSRASAAKAKTKLKVETDSDEEDFTDATAGDSDDVVATKGKASTKKVTPRRAVKKQSPTKSQYFSQPGRRQSSRKSR